MKVFACCNWQIKFLGPILDYWREQGHEVQYKLGYDPKLHEWADCCFVDVCDHNAQVASKNQFEGSRLVIRCIDIECWVRQPAGVTWANVDAVVFGAKHIEEMVKSYVNFPPNVEIVHVPYGLDVGKWRFRERDGRGRDVAFVAHRWSAKGLPLLLQVMAELGPGWRLHVLGTRNTERWLHAYWDHMVKELDLDVTETERVDDVDDWLEDKDVLLVTSQKEAFSYATAEAAAKGIKPVIHNFWRAKDIWPEDWIWDTVGQAAGMIDSGYCHSREYRRFIEENYSLERMMQGLDRVCGLGSS